MCFVGKVSSDGRVVLEHCCQNEHGEEGSKRSQAITRPVDLELDWVLGKMPQKVCV